MFDILIKVFLYVESDYIIKNLALKNKNKKYFYYFNLIMIISKTKNINTTNFYLSTG